MAWWDEDVPVTWASKVCSRINSSSCLMSHRSFKVIAVLVSTEPGEKQRLQVYLIDKIFNLTRFNKIAIQDKGPDGKSTRKPLWHLCVTRPSEICVNLVFKHIHAANC